MKRAYAIAIFYLGLITIGTGLIVAYAIVIGTYRFPILLLPESMIVAFVIIAMGDE